MEFDVCGFTAICRNILILVKITQQQRTLLNEDPRVFLCPEMSSENSQGNLQPHITHTSTWGIPLMMASPSQAGPRNPAHAVIGLRQLAPSATTEQTTFHDSSATYKTAFTDLKIRSRN
jgi:hypothetical protein